MADIYISDMVGLRKLTPAALSLPKVPGVSQLQQRGIGKKPQPVTEARRISSFEEGRLVKLTVTPVDSREEYSVSRSKSWPLGNRTVDMMLRVRAGNGADRCK